jgi:hypothetical protein
MQNATTLNVSIGRTSREVYGFVRNPLNLPLWATAFCRSVRWDGLRWIVQTTSGPIEIRFVDDNSFGVVDHFVTTSDGQLFYNPMRVIANEAGCEVLFTVFQFPGVSDERFAADKAMIERDLHTLKTVLEQSSSEPVRSGRAY